MPSSAGSPHRLTDSFFSTGQPEHESTFKLWALSFLDTLEARLFESCIQTLGSRQLYSLKSHGLNTHKAGQWIQLVVGWRERVGEEGGDPSWNLEIFQGPGEEGRRGIWSKAREKGRGTLETKQQFPARAEMGTFGIFEFFQ